MSVGQPPLFDNPFFCRYRKERRFHNNERRTSASGVTQRGTLSLMMKRHTWIALLGWQITQLLLGQDSSSIQKAAAKYVPGVAWRHQSVVSGNFSCRGRSEQAILGISKSEIVIAV